MLHRSYSKKRIKISRHGKVDSKAPANRWHFFERRPWKCAKDRAHRNPDPSDGACLLCKSLSELKPFENSQLDTLVRGRERVIWNSYYPIPPPAKLLSASTACSAWRRIQVPKLLARFQQFVNHARDAALPHLRIGTPSKQHMRPEDWSYRI